jgi:hypothetical protein
MAGFLHGTGHEAAYGVPLPAHLLHNLRQRCAVLPLQHRQHLRGLATFARHASWLRRGGPFALGRVLTEGGFLVALAFAGAPLAARAPPLAFGLPFGCAGASPCCVALSPKRWMRSQIRLIAVLVSLNFLIGFTPGRLFQMATSLSLAHAVASSVNSWWVLKLSNGVAVLVAAASALSNTTISLASLMVNVFMIVSPLRRCFAVTTWITLQSFQSKLILLEIAPAKDWR